MSKVYDEIRRFQQWRPQHDAVISRTTTNHAAAQQKPQQKTSPVLGQKGNNFSKTIQFHNQQLHDVKRGSSIMVSEKSRIFHKNQDNQIFVILTRNRSQFIAIWAALSKKDGTLIKLKY